jgi:hypothetical protein
MRNDKIWEGEEMGNREDKGMKRPPEEIMPQCQEDIGFREVLR